MRVVQKVFIILVSPKLLKYNENKHVLFPYVTVTWAYSTRSFLTP